MSNVLQLLRKLPLYVDNAATKPWSFDAGGYIPIKDEGTANDFVGEGGAMNVTVITDTTGLVAWKDYIPVKLAESGVAWSAAGYIPCKVGEGGGPIGELGYIDYLLSLSPARSFNLADREAGTYRFKDDVTNTYPDDCYQTNPGGNPDIFTNTVPTSSSAPIAGRGYLHLTYGSNPNGNNEGYWQPLKIKSLTDGDTNTQPPDGGCIIFAFYPGSASLSNDCRLFSWSETNATAQNDFPMDITYDHTNKRLLVGMADGTSWSYTLSVATAANSVNYLAWNYVIVKWDSVAQGGAVSVYLNGTKYTGTRTFAFAVPSFGNPYAGCFVQARVRTVGTQHWFFDSDVAEIAWMGSNYGNINDTTAAALYAKFQAGV